MSKLRPTDPPEQEILGSKSMDDLGKAVIVLTRELWVLTDRVLVMEKLLEGKGIEAGAIDAYQPDEAMTAKLDARRQRLIDTVVAALKGE